MPEKIISGNSEYPSTRGLQSPRPPQAGKEGQWQVNGSVQALWHTPGITKKGRWGR